MCIQVTNEHPEPTGVGLKVFRKEGRFLTGICSGRDIKKPMRKWLDEKDYRASGFWGQPEAYGFGWNICTTLEDARTWRNGDNVIRKVRYRKAFVSGIFMRDPSIIIIAKEIYILPGEVT